MQTLSECLNGWECWTLIIDIHCHNVQFYVSTNIPLIYLFWLSAFIQSNKFLEFYFMLLIMKKILYTFSIFFLIKLVIKYENNFLIAQHEIKRLWVNFNVRMEWEFFKNLMWKIELKPKWMWIFHLKYQICSSHDNIMGVIYYEWI